MTEDAIKKPSVLGKVLKTEVMLLIGSLFVGLVLLPVAVWFVGHVVFGAYDGAGYAEFYGMLSGKIRSGDAVAWFLILSPWLVLQCLRLMAFGWRSAAKA